MRSEHKAVLDSCKHLEKNGCRVTWLPVKPDGLIDLDQLKAAFTGQTILVTLMAANNETGVLQPIQEIGRLCRERGVLFHSDAVQALGRIPLDVNRAGIDLARSGSLLASGRDGSLVAPDPSGYRPECHQEEEGDVQWAVTTERWRLVGRPGGVSRATPPDTNIRRQQPQKLGHGAENLL